MTTTYTFQLNDTKVTTMKKRTFMKMLQIEEYPNLNQVTVSNL